MLDNAGGPSGVQVKNPFVIYTKTEQNKKEKTSFRTDFFFQQRHLHWFHYTKYQNSISFFSTQETDFQVTDFLKACILLCYNLGIQASTTIR